MVSDITMFSCRAEHFLYTTAMLVEQRSPGVVSIKCHKGDTVCRTALLVLTKLGGTELEGFQFMGGVRSMSPPFRYVGLLQFLLFTSPQRLAISSYKNIFDILLQLLPKTKQDFELLHGIGKYAQTQQIFLERIIIYEEIFVMPLKNNSIKQEKGRKKNKNTKP